MIVPDEMVVDLRTAFASLVVLCDRMLGEGKPEPIQTCSCQNAACSGALIAIDRFNNSQAPIVDAWKSWVKQEMGLNLQNPNPGVFVAVNVNAEALRASVIELSTTLVDTRVVLAWGRTRGSNCDYVVNGKLVEGEENIKMFQGDCQPQMASLMNTWGEKVMGSAPSDNKVELTLPDGADAQTQIEALLARLKSRRQ